MKSQSLTLCFTIWIKWTCVNIFEVTGYGKYMVFFQECNFGYNLCFFFYFRLSSEKSCVIPCIGHNQFLVDINLETKVENNTD